MLSALIQLGTLVSADRGEWDDIIDYPNIDNEVKKRVPLYVAEMIFDLDRRDIDFDFEEYDRKQSCLKYKYIKIQGGNNKAIYSCVESGKLEQIRKTFFGTTDAKGNPPVSGQFMEVLQKDFPAFKDTLLAKLLPAIFELNQVFVEKACTTKEVKGKEINVTDERKLIANIKELSSNDKVILYYTSVISVKDGLVKAIPISEVEGFEGFMRAKFLDKKSIVDEKLSYASGLRMKNVMGADFPNRYSLNYMFVETTLNYANDFNKNSFYKNYQLSTEEQLLLERGSRFVLDRLKIRIAGVDHCIIPQFLHSSTVDMPYITDGIFLENELLFMSSSIEKLTTRIKKETDHPFWLTYLAYESDGNFFKTIHQIKDVSKVQFYKVIETFEHVSKLFSEELTFAVDWPAVQMEYKRQNIFNLSTIYDIIPIRKEKEKKNEALFLFKCIFENRSPSTRHLFKSFCELVLCHRFQRYRSYTNIRKYEDRAFDFAIRDAVFKYLAFIHVLKQLKLTTIMEENELRQPPERSGSDYNQKIYAFFDRLEYKNDQKAMFFLGRMLSVVAFLQKDKKKNVLDKVNFNGMKQAAILRLRNDLVEKAKQYNTKQNNGLSKVAFSDAEFSKHFKYNGWSMNPEEAVFFILSGYSFGITLSKEINNQNTETNEK